MSQFAGMLHMDGRPVDAAQIAAFDRAIAQRGPDAEGRYEEPGITMLYRAFHITPEDRFDQQPMPIRSGTVLMWDGRLDNRDELIRELRLTQGHTLSDCAIASHALAAWDVKALPKLIGDWALAMWNPSNRRLVLARDYAGLRRLYYRRTEGSFCWSSDLGSLVLHGGEAVSPCDEYFAGYFTIGSEAHLTPYAEIELVPPGACVEVSNGRVRVNRYWSFNHLHVTRYRTDADYEEQFRFLFRQSVKRRLRTIYPIRVDLSGGLDSSSIVCMAHDLMSKGECSTAVMNTISFYALDEPGCDERPYIEAVEAFIGKEGTKLDLTAKHDDEFVPMRSPFFASLPGYYDRVIAHELELKERVGHLGNRIHMGGVGGDELLGGVQDPIPNLAGTLWSGHLARFAQETQAWALQRKTTVWDLLAKTLFHLSPIWLQSRFRQPSQTAKNWLSSSFVDRCAIRRRSLRVASNWRENLPGPATPDEAYAALASSIAGIHPRFTFIDETVMPFFDRDLVSFLLTIPGDQLLRPQQRRSLMRRGLRGIVPDVVLDRKTKALGRRRPALQLARQTAPLMQGLTNSPIGERYIDVAALENAVRNVGNGADLPMLPLERVLGAMYLFASIEDRGLLAIHPGGGVMNPTADIQRMSA